MEIIKNLGIKVTKYWANALRTIEAHELGVIKLSKNILDRQSQLVDELKFLQKNGFIMPIISPSDFGSGLDIVNIDVSNISICHCGEDDSPEITHINTEPIIRAIYEKKIPILISEGVHGFNILEVNTASLAIELAKCLRSKKLIMVGDTPILDSKGSIISEITSRSELNDLISTGVIVGDMTSNADKAYRFLDSMGPGHSVQITSLSDKSSGLIEELLGNGSGTKFTLPPKIVTYPFIDSMSDELEAMIQHSFGKKLKGSYLIELKNKNPTIFMDYKKIAGAITYKIGNVNYLCKLFTSPDYEGIGIARSILELIISQKHNLIWRTSKGNIGTTLFYERVISKNGGMKIEVGDYYVFSVNVGDDISEKIARIPSSFE